MLYKYNQEVMVSQEINYMYYVYILLNPLKSGLFKFEDYEFHFEPFYIGKGSDDRCNEHLYEAKYSSKKTLKLNIIRKILKENKKPIVKKYQIGDDENEAFQLEIKLIKLIGRRDKKLGPLANHTDGGEGSSGGISNMLGKTFEEIYGDERAKEIKKKISNKHKGRSHIEKMGIETATKWKNLMKTKFIGRKFSDKSIEKMSLVAKGKKLSFETKQKIGNFRRGKSYEEIFGEDKAKEIKLKQSENICLYLKDNWNKISGKSYEEIFGEDKAKEIKLKQSNAMKGKFQSNQKKEKCRNNKIGNLNPQYIEIPENTILIIKDYYLKYKKVTTELMALTKLSRYLIIRLLKNLEIYNVS